MKAPLIKELLKTYKKDRDYDAKSLAIDYMIEIMDHFVGGWPNKRQLAGNFVGMLSVLLDQNLDDWECFKSFIFAYTTR